MDSSGRKQRVSGATRIRGQILDVVIGREVSLNIRYGATVFIFVCTVFGPFIDILNSCKPVNRKRLISFRSLRAVSRPDVTDNL